MKNNKELKSYSESFKLKVISELESGKYSKKEITEVYGIGAGSVYRWIRKYGKLELLNKRIRIETMDDIDQIKCLKEEIRELKEALVQKQLDHFKSECYLSVAMDQLGYKDKGEFEKKADAKRLKKV